MRVRGLNFSVTYVNICTYPLILQLLYHILKVELKQIKTHGSESRGQGGSTLRRPLDERT